MAMEMVIGPISRLLSERVEPYRKSADGAILDDDPRDAAIADEAGKRHRQRGEADIGDPEPVEEAGRKSREQRRPDGDRHGHAHLEQPGQHTGRKAHHGSYR